MSREIVFLIEYLIRSVPIEKQFLNQSDLVPMYFKMICQTTFIGTQLAALVALEWFLTSVRPRVTLQITPSSASASK